MTSCPRGELAATAADALTDDELRRVSLGGAGGWVLLEPAPGPLDDGLGALVERLAARGARVVIAHPERHADADFEARLLDLAARGCLIQWTAEFIAEAEPGGFVMRLARRWTRPSARHRRALLAGRAAGVPHGGFERLRAVRSPAQLAWMAEDGPAAILRGEPVAPPW